jgi:hypothetical protein
MTIKCSASFWDMEKADAVRLFLPHTSNHAHIPGLSLVAKWTKYIPDGSTTKLKRVRTSQVSGIIVEGWRGTSIPHFHAHIPRSYVQWLGLSLVAR